MRLALCAASLMTSACTQLLGLHDFEPRPDAAVEDARVDDMGDASVQSGCPTEPGLVACYQFEGDGVDGSTNRLDAILSNVGFSAGVVGMALAVSASSTVTVAEHPALDVPMFTLEAWIKQTVMQPSGSRVGIIDNNEQYGVFVLADGTIRCIAPPITLEVNPGNSLDQWTHVACTYDLATLTIYVDGIPRSTLATAGGVPTTGTTGLSIAGDNPSGAPLIGLIDEVRLWGIARSSTEVCRDTGLMCGTTIAKSQ